MKTDMSEALGVRLVEVGAGYGRRPVIDGITTPRFTGGDLVAVLGLNGSGKSTLLKRMAGLLEGPGRVELSGAGRADIGYLPQDLPSPAGLTVYESVLLSARRDAGWSVPAAELSRVEATLAMLGLTPLAFRGLDTLSGGQRQLASIAQSLVRQPRLLLMDEPTSALDLHRQFEILKILRNLAEAQGVIVFVSLHDVNLALRFASHAMVIANGTLTACGSSSAIISTEMMESTFRVSARIETCSKGISIIIVDDD
ncbi:ABC transporter ATP-binding protein [Xanthobacter sp. 126]|uniref:ABC transporter ATP-binding protein n=1 Tax=Xanthobacter sp. 126 TaxID=1131814 RepID=UPI0004B60860|nr:ABC transporter ATP-binding protein [Xanthobacter sp. 126]